MLANFAYVLILFSSVLIPAIFTFENNFKFYLRAIQLIFATILGALIFVPWDIFFTKIGIWGFNKKYLTGIKLANLPLEEVMFFIIIPYACIFLYEAFYYHFDFNPLKGKSRTISMILIVFTQVLAWTNFDKAYTFTSMIFLSVVIIFAEFIFKTKKLDQFYFVYLIILIPFAITNGILTGSFIPGEIVWYNDAHNLGLRLGTIPFEDAFYGMSLILLDFSLFKLLTNNLKHPVQTN